MTLVKALQCTQSMHQDDSTFHVVAVMSQAISAVRLRL